MKYALVTGGSRGIGRAICLKLKEMGYFILVNYVSNQAAAEETSEPAPANDRVPAAALEKRLSLLKY